MSQTILNTSQCPVCNNEHHRGISELLTGPDSLKFLSRFFEISEVDLEHHKTHCMKT